MHRRKMSVPCAAMPKPEHIDGENDLARRYGRMTDAEFIDMLDGLLHVQSDSTEELMMWRRIARMQGRISEDATRKLTALLNTR